MTIEFHTNTLKKQLGVCIFLYFLYKNKIWKRPKFYKSFDSMETRIKISFNVKSIQWVKRFLAQKRKYLKGIQNK